MVTFSERVKKRPNSKIQLVPFVRRVDRVRVATNREKSEKVEKSENNEETKMAKTSAKTAFLESTNSKISSSLKLFKIKIQTLF